MSTHAKYILWVGISKESYKDEKHPSILMEFIGEIEDGWEPLQKWGLSIEPILMHGETVGIGVVVSQLNWEVSIGEQNIFDASVIARVEEAQKALNRIFDGVGISLRALAYNHLDLAS